MAVDIQSTFRRGGRGVVDLLEFCVISVKLDAVFVFLVGDYQLKPTAPRAIALYDVFCTPASPARISVMGALPPRNLQTERVVEQLRQQYLSAQSTETADRGPDEQEASGSPPAARAVPFPGKYVFDGIASQVWAGQQLRWVVQTYDPALSPHENLPGGRLTAGQRAFVENIWEPAIRPHLVSAGFRRIANIA